MKKKCRSEKWRKTSLWMLLAILLAAGVFVGGRNVQAATPYKTNGRLSVSKGKIVNSKKKPFVIKGVSTHGLAWYPEYVNKKSFKTLRDKWGVNTVRFAMYTAEYNGYCTGGNKADLKKTIEQGVKDATDLGMYVIIDWHILSDGNPLTYKSEAKKFFKEIAKKYAGYGNVMFEICNEPNGSEGTWKNIKSYAEEVIKTIRSVNKKAIIIVGTPTWSQDVDQAQASPVKGYSNIVYAFHFYAGTHKDQLRNKLEEAVKKGLPVLVSEFGICDASGNGSVDTAEGNKWMKLLDKYSIGRVCWSLTNKDEAASLLKSSCKKTTGGWTSADISASGKWLIKKYTGKNPPASSSKTTQGTTKKTEQSSSDTDNDVSVNGTSGGTVKLAASAEIKGTWKNGDKYCTQYNLVLKNKGSETSSTWQITVKMRESFSLTDKWCGSFQKKNKELIIKPLDWNQKLEKNGQTEIGFIMESQQEQAVESVTVTAS